jgi:Zn-dependent M28 family amino/carboxypeptidase
MQSNFESNLYSPFKFDKVRSRLLEQLVAVTRERDPYLAAGNHRLVRQLIQHRLSQWGTVVAHEFTVRGQPYVNWILKFPGSASQQPPVLIGAHYDTVPGTPGADDNATGIAVLLELAKFLATFPPAIPVWLVAFDMEEYGLLGSQAYAADLQAAEQPLQLMLSLEMLGYCDRAPHSQAYPSPILEWLYPHTGDFIALVGNLTTLPTMWRLGQHIERAGAHCRWLPVPNQGRAIPATRRSDHASFWDCGYPAIMVTDTAFLRNPHYHQSSDRLDTLDLDFMTQICLGLTGWLSRLT